jgi:hypothetical protein
MSATYAVSWWDHEEERWIPEWPAVGLFGIRVGVRDLLGRGFCDDCSILVERNAPDAAEAGMTTAPPAAG